MQQLYSAPLPDVICPTLKGGYEDFILSSQKPVVVLLTKVIAEAIERDDDSGLRPIEEGGHGMLVQDTDGSQHEFDTVNEAKEFARAQYAPDRNPVETKILEFRNGKWEVIEHFPSCV